MGIRATAVPEVRVPSYSTIPNTDTLTDLMLGHALSPSGRLQQYAG